MLKRKMISVEKLLKLARDFEAYQPLKRKLNYQKVGKYIDPKEVVAYLSYSYQTKNYVRTNDHANSVGVAIATEIIESPATPCYLVTEELTNALLQTDLPDHAYTVKPFVPIGLILLPPIIKSPEGTPLRWLFFCCLKAGRDQCFSEHPDGTINFQSDLQTLKMDKITWYSYLHPFSYTGTVKLDIEEQNINYGDQLRIIDYKVNDEEKEQLFINSVSNFLINLMLYMMYRNDLPSKNLVSVNKGFAKPLPKLPSTHPKIPIWIGKEYQAKMALGNQRSSGTHASPRIHWRRGHWKNQPYGREGRLRKLIWIEPNIINDAE